MAAEKREAWWSYFQSKSIKAYRYEIQKDVLEAEVRANEGAWPARSVTIYPDLAAGYGRQIARDDGEKGQPTAA